MLYSNVDLPFYLLMMGLLSLRVFVALSMGASLRAFVPLPLLAVLSLILVFPIVPFLPTDVKLHTLGPMLIVVALGEAALGFLFGLAFWTCMELLPQAARLLDVLRGSQLGEQLLPELAERTSPLSSLVTLFGLVLLLQLGLYQLILGPLLHSFRIFPPGVCHYILVEMSGQLTTLLQQIHVVAGQVMGQSIFVVATALLIFFFLDVAVGVIGKALKGSSLIQELSAVKLVLGIVLAIWIIPALGQRLVTFFVFANSIVVEFQSARRG